MSRLDDLIDEFRSDGREDDAEELEKLRGSNLRKAAGKAEQLQKELDKAKAELETERRGPAVRKAFEDAEVDFDSLSKAEKRAIESYDGDVDGDSISKFIEELDLPVKEDSEPSEGEEDAEEEPAAARQARAARKAPEGKGRTAPKVKPSDVEDWSMEKAARFMADHPDEWEALKRGETVTVS